jgi:hypothetical protein
VLCYVVYEPKVPCSLSMYEYLIAYLIILLMMLILELFGMIVSSRGTVNDTKPRKFLQHIIYSRLGNFYMYFRNILFYFLKRLFSNKCILILNLVLLIVEFCFIVFGSISLNKYKDVCHKNWYDRLMRKALISKNFTI